MTRPFAIAGLDHVVLRTGRVDAMVGFYRDVLGCPVEKVQEAFGLTQLRAGNTLIDLVDTDGPLGRSGGPPPSASARNMDLSACGSCRGRRPRSWHISMRRE
jgi:glyoxylase I family protein